MLRPEPGRRPEVADPLAAFPVTLCGAGALGSHLAYHLVKLGGRKLKIIDRDRVESRNLPAQLWAVRDVGVQKCRALQNIIHRDTGILIDTAAKEMTAGNARSLLNGAGLVVDLFDNWASRRLAGEAARTLGVPCLHGGLSADGFAEVKWDDVYTYGVDDGGEAREPPCDFAPARGMVILTVAVLGEAVDRFIASGQKINREITLGDLRVWEV